MYIEQVFNQLGKTRNGRRARLENAEWKPLPDAIWLEQWKFPAGSLVKVFETKNFGWIAFHPDTVLADGSKPIRRLFKW